MKSTCQICGSTEWHDLPDPHPVQSVTTAGRIVKQPLGKSQCAKCGFLQRVRAEFLGYSDYYEKDYATYYNRPGTTQFHRRRYSTMVEWIRTVLKSAPKRILDAGCGQGWAMEAMRDLFPHAVIEGLDPSSHNVSVAREKGFVVYEGRLGDVELSRSGYDLVISTNVIQHVTDARQFIGHLKKIVTNDGTIVITCPDGSLPNVELLWSDQNFSFLPVHLVDLCKGIGFESVRWSESPRSPALPPSQMVVLSAKEHASSGAATDTSVRPSLPDVLRRRCEYLQAFSLVQEHILREVSPFSVVFNLGASYWSSVLAAYCPSYWEKVDSCLVDNLEDATGSFLGKPVRLMNSNVTRENAVIVLGTSPAGHASLVPRLKESWVHVVAWDQFVPF
ncbi:MAG: class I SAM-dependent methyltransferase [Verrucomicrobia bacterium]|nr:class I SAM-dependent methyltransferase [Verrucomicrobiota bacterium]